VPPPYISSDEGERRRRRRFCWIHADAIVYSMRAGASEQAKRAEQAEASTL